MPRSMDRNRGALRYRIRVQVTRMRRGQRGAPAAIKDAGGPVTETRNDRDKANETTPESERQDRQTERDKDDDLDQALEETFPASDPLPPPIRPCRESE